MQLAPLAKFTILHLYKQQCISPHTHGCTGPTTGTNWVTNSCSNLE